MGDYTEMGAYSKEYGRGIYIGRKYVMVLTCIKQPVLNHYKHGQATHILNTYRNDASSVMLGTDSSEVDTDS